MGSSLFLASLIDLFFFPCALGAFILMDCLVVTAPRTRSFLAFTLLFMLLERLGNYYASDLPSSLERAGLVGSMISSLETAVLTVVGGAMASLLGAPRAMTFIKLPTTLMELVLFEQGAREACGKMRGVKHKLGMLFHARGELNTPHLSAQTPKAGSSKY